MVRAAAQLGAFCSHRAFWPRAGSWRCSPATFAASTPLGATPVPARRTGTAHGNAVESRPEGGQASDQASERRAKPAPARSPGHLIAKTPPKTGQQDLEPRASTTGATLTNAPDGTNSVSQQDLTPGPTQPFEAVSSKHQSNCLRPLFKVGVPFHPPRVPPGWFL
jgi:hypothetical protein